MTDLEGAVERVSDVARRFDHKGGFPSESSDLRTILDALASIRNELDDALHDYGNAESEAKAAEAEVAELKEALASITRERDGYLAALTPDAETKFAYIGEIKFSVCQGMDDEGCEIWGDVTIPWDATKATMAMIAKYAALVNGEGGE